MNAQLSSRCGFGLVNGRPLFLDLDSDSYFLLERDEEVRWLAHGGKLARVTRVPKPVRSLLDSKNHSRTTQIGQMIGFARLLLRTRRALACRPLADLIDEAITPRVARTRQDRPSLALGFLNARRWIPIEPHCLTDSLALLTYLHDHGERALLVFGAKLDPFAAHCWLQADGLLLNDRIDRIEGFVPVLALGG